MRGRVIPIQERAGWGRGAALRRLLVVVCALVPSVAAAQLKPCDRDAQRIADAVARIESSIDPCGQSAEVLEVIEQVKTCRLAIYEICTDSAAARNVFDRPEVHPRRIPPSRTITWNPELRTELEPGCTGDLSAPLERDPTASLLHELAHAAQDCRGLNPGEHELEAVRIENIYRRAAGLCERSGYGDTILPASMVSSCAVTRCSCSGDEAPVLRTAQSDPIHHGATSGATSGVASKEMGGEVSGDRPPAQSARPQRDGATVQPRADAASVGVGG